MGPSSNRTCFCDWFLPGGPSPLCLHPCFYSVQEVPSQGDANPCRVGFSQYQNLHLGCSPSHDECRRHHPYLAVGPRCPSRSHSVLPLQFPSNGHTGWNYSTTSTGWLISQKCTSTRTSYTTTSMELSLSTLTSTAP